MISSKANFYTKHMKQFGFLAFVFAMLVQPGTVIPVRNPSFEDDAPTQSKSPKGWQSITPGSTPDILPGAWGIQFAAQDGKTCVGLVSREDGSVEDISQGLPETLKSGTCYTFSIHLAHASKYVGFNHPLRLRIWGSASRGKKEVLLTSSKLIDHNEWRKYSFQFVPTRDIRFITLEAGYGPGISFTFKGNFLRDNVS